MHTLSDKPARYLRQIALDEIGEAGQARLAKQSVLIIGAGGLGSASIYYLAAAGIGTLGLVDPDQVEMSNLNRQILHATRDIGRRKVDSAVEKVRRLNPEITLKTYPQKADAKTLVTLIADYDFIIDATDNFTARYLISDTCVKARKAFSHAGVSGFCGQTFTYVPGKAAGCYRCLFFDRPSEEVLPDKAAGGILGAVAGTLGTIQATEAVKFLTTAGDLLVNRLWVYDGKRMTVRLIAFKKRDACSVCSSVDV
ncbi:HesA/MoeB/ThiF family protein [bacterium]|nr:HesA/MoeB/ThiF family protein [bacterium]